MVESTLSEAPRALSARERDVLELMASRLPAGHPAHAKVPHAQVTSTCLCGTCPSISLREDAEGHRVVVEAFHPTGMLLLFVDGDHPSYLELAPNHDDVVTEFPPAHEIVFE